jgi:muramoyltetrapeptide carboxypeptidase
VQLKAKILHPGDVIGIIAPASPPRSEDRISKSIAYFERLGYRVELGNHVRDNMGDGSYLAASDKDRAADLHAMFRSKHVRAIFYHRGGYGSIRLLDTIDYDLVRQNPKIIVGYSDATALFAALYKKSGLASCFFGPMPGVDLWDSIDPFTEEQFWRAMTSSKPLGAFPIAENEGVALNPKKALEAHGRMIGGNLTVFTSLLGTPYQPSLTGKILFIEEIDEKPRKLDAHFAQLRLAGVFDRAGAILLGQFTNCNNDPDAPTLTLQEIFADYFGKLKIPVLSNLPFGHEKRMWTIPYGSKLHVHWKNGRAKITALQRVLE